MRIGEVPAVDVRGPLTAQRGRLVSLLASLSDAQWAAPTAGPQWSVKDVALHLLDVDLSWLAHDRDHDKTGIIPVPPGHDEFVCGLAAIELLPLEADRHEEALVQLAFLAQVAVEPALADAAEGAAQRLQGLLAARIAHALRAGELPAHLDPEQEAARLRVLLDGLRLQLITTPRHASATWALAVLDDHFAALAAASGAGSAGESGRSVRDDREQNS